MLGVGVFIFAILVFIIWNRIDNYYTKNNKTNKAIRDTILIVIGLAILFSFIVAINHNEYFDRYSGSYTVEIIGHSSEDEVELYLLHKSGDAKWMYLIGTKKMSEKIGTWEASEGKISISIQGNTEPIKEEYVLKNGVFVNSAFSNRNLKRTE